MRHFWILGALVATIAASAGPKDGASIINSGSTNTEGYTMKVWSDGTGEVSGARTGDSHKFQIDADLTPKFFADLKAARANPGTPGHCMKSASFGTTTVVSWHGWQSTDLQCPPFNAAMTALVTDVRAIQAAANWASRRRIPLPRDMRKIPATPPEATPT